MQQQTEGIKMLPAMNQNKIAPVLAQVTRLQNQSLTMLTQ